MCTIVDHSSKGLSVHCGLMSQFAEFFHCLLRPTCVYWGECGSVTETRKQRITAQLEKELTATCSLEARWSPPLCSHHGITYKKQQNTNYVGIDTNSILALCVNIPPEAPKPYQALITILACSLAFHIFKHNNKNHLAIIAWSFFGFAFGTAPPPRLGRLMKQTSHNITPKLTACAIPPLFLLSNSQSDSRTAWKCTCT